MDGMDERIGKRGVSRRAVVVGGIGAGFALAVQPISAQTLIMTPIDGMEAGDVTIKTGTGDMPGYRAYPKTSSNFPTVLVVPEVFGLHEHIKDVCRRLAKAGYYAIAPQVFFRLGDPAKVADIQTVLSTIIMKKPDAEAMSDYDATVAFAKAEGKADTNKLGVTGFCFGGRYVWMYSAHNPNIKAGVAWYGSLMTPPTNELRPKNPVDIAGQLKAPVLGLYGAKDTGITQEHVETMRKAIAAAGKKAEIVVYPDVGHAFNADYRASYNKEAAEDGWKRMLAFFKANGVA
ncbi:MAG: dienelactone hydrolase family protein [Rhodospirillales bacterium]